MPNEGRGTDAHHGSVDQGARTGKGDYEYKGGRQVRAVYQTPMIRMIRSLPAASAAPRDRNPLLTKTTVNKTKTLDKTPS